MESLRFTGLQLAASNSMAIHGQNKMSALALFNHHQGPPHKFECCCIVEVASAKQNNAASCRFHRGDESRESRSAVTTTRLSLAASQGPHHGCAMQSYVASVDRVV